MNQFIIKTLAFSFTILMVFLWVCSKANGSTDPFYMRFTTPKQSSLILGTSKAAQGLHPRVLDSILKKQFYNYSFTISHSPFGQTYLNSIKKKLDLQSKNGIFIVTVDPWSISSFTKDPEDSLAFRENKLALANTKFVNLNPNVFYLLNNWGKKYYQLLSEKEKNVFLHSDGWLEVNIKLDSLEALDRLENRLEIYRKDYLTKAKFSQNRLHSLEETINFLKSHGKVFLVRLPIHPEIMKVDNELIPEFNRRIQKAINLSDGYLDLTNRNTEFHYRDGVHLIGKSGKLVSEIVANWISEK